MAFFNWGSVSASCFEIPEAGSLGCCAEGFCASALGLTAGRNVRTSMATIKRMTLHSNANGGAGHFDFAPQLLVKRDVAGRRLNLYAGFTVADSRPQFVLVSGSFHDDRNGGVNIAGAGVSVKPKTGGRRDVKSHFA